MRVPPLITTAILGVISCLAMAVAHGQVVTGSIAAQKNYQNWNSFLLTIGGTTTPRAATTDIESGIVMAMDFFSEDCSVAVNFLVPMSSHIPTDNTRHDVVVSLRADSRIRFDLHAFSMVTMGDSTGIVSIRNTDQFHSLITEMKRGVSLRAKIAFGGDESTATYMTYSLAGFTAAYTRSQELCLKSSARSGSRPIDRL